MGATYREAGGPRKVAHQYIEKYHRHVKDITVLYLFTDQPIRAKGREKATKTQKVSGLGAYLTTRDSEGGPIPELIVILVNEEAWKLFDEAKREAAMDQALMYISVDQESGKIDLRGHDVESFTEILERHGAWEPDLQEFLAAAKTPMLPGLEDAKQTGAAKKGGAAKKIIPRERTIAPKRSKPGAEL